MVFRWGLILTLLGFCLSNVFAGSVGKISGRINDKGSDEPLIGANVVVQGTALGASTDLEGYYVILNIPPGKYTLQISYIGFNDLVIQDVSVSSDLTTQIDAELTETTLETSETITVIAERQAIQKDMTATTAVVGSEQIEGLPVTEIQEILSLQAGFVDGHVRGGRSGEIAYWIDGVPVTDVYDGGTVVDVNKDMVEELQFISGAFNAEYGQAMSGIVNITTKEPSESFGGSATFYAGDYYSDKSTYWNLNNFNPANIYNAEGGLFGIIIPNKLSYYVNARYIYFGGWLYGKDVYKPHNISYKDSLNNFVLSRPDLNGLGDGDYVPMNWNRKMYAQGKLIYNLTPTVKLSYSLIWDDVDYQDYDRYYRLNPDGNLNRFREGKTQILKLSHLLNQTTFYDLGVSYFDKTYKNYIYEDKYDSRYVHPRVGSNIPSYNYSTGGMNLQYFTRQTKTFLMKLDLTSQITKRHLVKAGAEFRRHELSFDDITLRPVGGDNLDLTKDSPFMDPMVFPVSSPFHSKYGQNPVEMSLYVQDKMEFEDLIVNIGVRFDHFQPDGQVLADPEDPNIYLPIKPENWYEDINQNNRYDDGIDRILTFEEREAKWYKKASDKTQISPRLGVSFPVTATGVVHFSYGHFFQVPNFEYLYRNPQFKLGSGTGNQGIIGNADLEPQQTVSGEIGYKQEVGNGLVLDVTAYFRDIRDLVGTRAEEIEVFGGAATYSRLANSDFGLIKGIIFSAKSPYQQGLNYTFDYTYQIAEGTASDPEAARNALAAGQDPEVQLVALGWDQRHTVNLTSSYIAPSWGASVIGTFGSGLPYTPRKTADVSELRENSESKPSTWNVDLRLHKDFEIFGRKITYFLRVLNVFDRHNENSVYDDTGSAGYTTDLERIRALNPEMPINSLDSWFSNETFYSEPRRIETGITLNF